MSPKSEQPAAGSSSRPGDALLEVRHLKKYFPVRKGVFSRVVAHVKAVDDVSFAVPAGKTLGLVGESGCGKTTIGRTILRLYPPTAGEVIFDGTPVYRVGRRALRGLRRDMQLIFQDPYGSLNPRMTVGAIVGEALAIHRIGARAERRERVKEILRRVGLAPDHVNRYPHEFSGGQRQRIGIARAIALNPRFIVCDEAVSALDVSIQAQVINLLQDLQQEYGIAYLFIAHDLSVVRHISDEVAVMYLGKIVENSPTESLFQSPLHPYTEALLSAVPVPDPKTKRKRIVLPGDVPSPIDPPEHCRFYARGCLRRRNICRWKEPVLVEHKAGHHVACFAVTGDPTEPLIKPWWKPNRGPA